MNHWATTPHSQRGLVTKENSTAATSRPTTTASSTRPGCRACTTRSCERSSSCESSSPSRRSAPPGWGYEEGPAPEAGVRAGVGAGAAPARAGRALDVHTVDGDIGLPCVTGYVREETGACELAIYKRV